jgi:hypothetical protein
MKLVTRYFYSETSLEGFGARGEAAYAGPLLKISRCTKNEERRKREKKTKPVTCKFNISGANLYIY